MRKIITLWSTLRQREMRAYVTKAPSAPELTWTQNFSPLLFLVGLDLGTVFPELSAAHQSHTAQAEPWSQFYRRKSLMGNWQEVSLDCRQCSVCPSGVESHSWLQDTFSWTHEAQVRHSWKPAHRARQQPDDDQAANTISTQRNEKYTHLSTTDYTVFENLCILFFWL